MKINKFLFLGFLLLSFVSGQDIKGEAASNNFASASQTYLEEIDDVDSYYSESLIEGTIGDELLEALANQMNIKHRYYTNYDELRGTIPFADEDENDPTKIRAFYGGLPISNYWDPNNNSNVEGWNREHVWCKSLSGGAYPSVSGSNRNAGTDIHQIVPSLNGINSSRGNKPYADLNKDGTEIIYKHTTRSFNTGNYYSEQYFEPHDGVKGDVARILMYVYTHYSSEVENSSKDYSGDLKFENIVYGGNNSQAASINLLLKWHKDDPVSDFEIKRNNYCHSVTGVRNPFIDHPEFALMIWDNSYSGQGALIDNSFVFSRIEVDSLSLSQDSLTMNINSTYQLFTLFSPSNVSSTKVTYKSSNENVAVVEYGLVKAIGEGETSITVTSSNGKSASCKVKVNNLNIDPNKAKTWNLVKSIDDIDEGSKVIIVAKDSDYALSTNQKSNNRAAISITKQENKIVTIDEESEEKVDSFIVGKVNNDYTLYSEALSGYLYAVGTGNHLRTQSSINAKAIWTISISSTGTATIKTIDSSVSQNWMRFNKTSSLFACYTKGQQDIALYVLDEVITPNPNPGDETTTVTPSTSSTPSTTTVPPTTTEVPPTTTNVPPTTSEVPPSTSGVATSSGANTNKGCAKANNNILVVVSIIVGFGLVYFRRKD